MSFWQKLIFSFVSKERAAAMEAESRDWFVRGKCGHETSIWDLGGVRYKAYSKGKRTFLRCPTCGERSWHSWHKKSEEQPTGDRAAGEM